MIAASSITQSAMAGLPVASVPCRPRQPPISGIEPLRSLSGSPPLRRAWALPQRPDHVNATKISPALSSAWNCRSRGATSSPRLPTASAATKAAGSRRRPRCAAFLMAFATCPRLWRSSRRGYGPQLAQWLDFFASAARRKLNGMGCTFTAVVLRGRIAHVLHVGDTRAYRLRNDRFTLPRHRPRS